MVSTEGSQCFIGNSTPQTTDIRESFPLSYFTLRINSNDLYSREKYPNNNCHNFTIDFPQETAESIQSRISQCNRFQIINLKTPVRNHKGILTGKNRHYRTSFLFTHFKIKCLINTCNSCWYIEV